MKNIHRILKRTALAAIVPIIWAIILLMGAIVAIVLALKPT